MERRSPTPETLLTLLRGLTECDQEWLEQLLCLLDVPASSGEPETARQHTARLGLWRRLLQDIPLDERSFDGRFGLDSRREVIEALTSWCLDESDPCTRQRARHPQLFGFVSLFLLTLLSLAESEAQRSLPQAAAAPARSGAALTHDCDRICGALVEQASVAEAICEVYQPRRSGERGRGAVPPAVREWQTVQQETLRFHRHGSTSMILRGTASTAVHGTRPQFALKLILYPFTRIQTITHATRQYAETYDTSHAVSRHLVHVWASFDSWVLMDFIAGKTLAETVREEIAQEPGNPGDTRSLRLDRLHAKGILLFDALEELQRLAREEHQRLARDETQTQPGGMQGVQGVQGVHADLSPSNIIVSDTDGTFKLIDLGRNYLYTHAITGATGVESSYIAPEVKSGEADIARADLYSLGQFLILFACGRASPDGVVPDIFYMRALPLARFVEDLIDASPSRRLLIFTAGQAPEFSFTDLKESFLAELRMVQATAPEQTVLRAESGWSALRELLRPLAGDPVREWRLWRNRRQQEDVRRSTNRMQFTNWLLFWSVVAAAAWALTNATVVTWLLRDLNLSWGDRVVEAIQHLFHDPTGLPIVDAWRNSDYRVPDLWHNLPARMVGLSYALAAPKYYEMLFSGLTPLAVGRRAGSLSRLSVAAEVIMRAMAVLPSVLVMTATLIEPRWWPINTAIGQWLTWLANSVTRAWIRSVIARSRAIGLSTLPADDSKITGYSSFSQWSPASLFYATAVLAIGSLIYVHVLHDVYVYALAATSTNIFLFYIIKCGIGGPTIRVTMARSCLAAERVGRCLP